MRLFLYADTQTSLVNVDNKRNLLSVVFFGNNAIYFGREQGKYKLGMQN